MVSNGYRYKIDTGIKQLAKSDGIFCVLFSYFGLFGQNTVLIPEAGLVS
jgi:hypothetical protein